MDEQTPPSNPVPDPNPISPLENALRQIQTWFVNGEFQKAKQGCEEVLKVSPNNSIAQDLLKKAEEGLSKTATVPTLIETQEVAPQPIAPLAPEIPSPPAYDLKMEGEKSTTTPMSPLSSNDAALPHEEHHKTHSLIANLVLLFVLLGVGMGGVYAYKTFINPTKEEAEAIAPNEENEDLAAVEEEAAASQAEELADQEMEARNNQRLADLTALEKALIQYYDESHEYPTVETINTILIEKGLIDEMPTPPQEGEVYFYAVYNNELGNNQVYILSAEFENGEGSTEIWATGGNILEFTDFHEVSQPNVTVLHPTITEEEYLTSLETENTDETPSEEPKERVPRT